MYTTKEEAERRKFNEGAHALDKLWALVVRLLQR